MNLLQQSRAVCLCYCAASLVPHIRVRRLLHTRVKSVQQNQVVWSSATSCLNELERASHHSPLQLEPWKLEPGDHTLLDLLPFLEAIYSTHRGDVRTVLKTYEGQDIPSAFR